MNEILITSSVLIVALLLLRRVFRRSISRRAQYALWGLVALRLLLPFYLPAVEHNVLTAAEPVNAAVTARLEAPRLYDTPVSVSPAAQFPGAENAEPGGLVPTAQSFGYPVLSQNGATVTTYANRLDRPITLAEDLRMVWYAGIAVMAVWFLFSNLRFSIRLRQNRTSYPVENCEYPVFLVERGLPSPCLFGLFRPAIYLTPAAISSPERLRHVLAHEKTHARHLDPLWSLLRAVCLAVYWFDPLVWAAAVVSRGDCELACDEGALKTLGEAERIAYGKTLLSLIPVRRSPANPLLSATTMTAGKRQLKERITRIAENRRQLGTALFAVLAVTALVCAATFTGAAKAPGGENSGSLTGDELQYFNETFFNSENALMHNQFLTSTYEKPEDIDLFQLFYCGTGLPEDYDDAERQAVARAAYGGADPGVDLTKCTAAGMDAVLLENTGLTLAETAQYGLSNFTHLAEYGAYYHFHGDTNVIWPVDIIAGERVGEQVKLYYEASYDPDGWRCLTLRETEAGGYHFVSHLSCDMPEIPTAYPADEPWMTIPLDGLTAYTPQVVPTRQYYRQDFAQLLWSTYSSQKETAATLWEIQIYRSVDGSIRAALVDPLSSAPNPKCFLTLPETVSDSYVYEHVHYFRNLFGYSGVAISYPARLENGRHTTFHDYFTVEDGAVYLLARAYGEASLIDLNGDRTYELAANDSSSAQLFFQKDGQLYEADIDALLAERWQESVFTYFGLWNRYARCLYLTGEIPFPGETATGSAGRQLYFDGANLLLYHDGRATVNHVLGDHADVPGDVLQAARTFAQDQRAYLQTREAGENPPAEYDDWRVEITGGPWFETLGEQTYEIWNINYELHTTTPERIILAGASYLTEDGWHCPTYPNCTYLYFRTYEDGRRIYLYADMENDCGPGIDTFREDMEARLAELGLPDSGEAERTEGLQAANLAQQTMDEIAAGDLVYLTLDTAGAGGGGRYGRDPELANGPNRRLHFDTSFHWSMAEAAAPQGPTLTLESRDGSCAIQCWQNSELVRCTRRDETVWLLAEQADLDDVLSGSVFSYLRFWYDEAEIDGLSPDIVIPDRGQSRLEIAQAWSEQATAANLLATSGSKFACTYVRVTAEVDSWADMPEAAYPDWTGGRERFFFSYTRVFVPENEDALHWQMAGNTGNYTGEPGTAPEGAYENYQIGCLYLAEDGWRCDGTGTGP